MSNTLNTLLHLFVKIYSGLFVCRLDEPLHCILSHMEKSIPDSKFSSWLFLSNMSLYSFGLLPRKFRWLCSSALWRYLLTGWDSKEIPRDTGSMVQCVKMNFWQVICLSWIYRPLLSTIGKSRAFPVGWLDRQLYSAPPLQSSLCSMCLDRDQWIQNV